MRCVGGGEGGLGEERRGRAKKVGANEEWHGGQGVQQELCETPR